MSKEQETRNIITQGNTNSSMEDPGRQRVKSWKDKEKKEAANLKFSAHKKEDSPGILLNHKVINNNNADYTDNEIALASFAALSGSSDSEYSRLFVGLAAGAMSTHEPTEKSSTLAINAFQGAMLSMAPQDVIESQLCAKMVILHTQAMNCMNKASTISPEYQQVIDQYTKNAAKMMRLHNETVEALTRYRRQGEQRVKVVHQYVQVNEGGQAVVAADTRGGGNEKK